jgi:hypothetical protein
MRILTQSCLAIALITLIPTIGNANLPVPPPVKAPVYGPWPGARCTIDWTADNWCIVYDSGGHPTEWGGMTQEECQSILDNTPGCGPNTTAQ